MIWFPTRIQLRSYKKDGPTSDAIASSDTVKVNYHEDWTLSAIRLNDEIPDEVFTFKGMGLTKGTSVHILSDQPEFARVWNGNEVVIAELPSMPAPQVADHQPRRIRYLPAILAFNAIVFLIFGAVLVWKARNGKECK